jgi:hypothetical protein
MLGVDMDKLFKEQEKKLRQSAEREQLIREGVMSEHDDVQAHSARKCWSGRKRREALVYRRNKGAERKPANNLIKLPADERLHAMSEWIYRTLPPDEAYWCTSERLKALAIQHLYQLDLALSPRTSHRRHNSLLVYGPLTGAFRAGFFRPLCSFFNLHSVLLPVTMTFCLSLWPPVATVSFFTQKSANE